MGSVLLYLWMFLIALNLVKATEQTSIATQRIQYIIHDIRSWQNKHDKSLPRPFVAVTYAQSIDGQIALLLKEATSSNFALSDPESLRMTHALRSIHDAILVGGRTLSVDNPRLNNRLWDPCKENQPRPVVLDTHLKHIRTLGSGCRANNILVCCSHEAAKEVQNAKNLPELLPCPLDPQTGRIDLDYVLQTLKAKYQIESVMVEGGSSVLTAFYSRPDLLDCLCVTIAPKLLLWSGLPAISKDGGVEDRGVGSFILDAANLEHSKFLQLGNDSIFLAKLVRAHA